MTRRRGLQWLAYAAACWLLALILSKIFPWQGSPLAQVTFIAAMVAGSQAASRLILER